MIDYGLRQRRFEKDAPVWVSRLGPMHGDARYRAEVVGVAVDEEGPHPAVYIIRLLEPIRENYDFDYMAITGACLDERGNVQE